jgi:predicted DNA-binding transcriptional regulator AlpA
MDTEDPVSKILEDALADQIKKALHSSLGQSAQPTFGDVRHGPLLVSEPQVFTISEFCSSYKISRSHLYELFRDGLGPRIFKVGNSLRVTKAAAAAWVAARESTYSATAKKAKEA